MLKIFISTIFFLSFFSQYIKANDLEDCKNGEKKPLSGECIYYNLCIDGKYKPFKCGSTFVVDSDGILTRNNNMFNPETNVCEEKRKLPVTGACQRYKECVISKSVSHIEKWIERECPESLHFDKVSNQCIASNNSSCEVCNKEKCQNGGFCNIQNHKCMCPMGFTGDSCEVKSNPCQLNTCANNGKCYSDNQENVKCICLTGYTGPNCEETELNSNYSLVSTLTSHTNNVRSVAFSRTGLLASGSDDRSIKLWNTDTGELINTLTSHTYSVWSVAFSPKGLLASGSNDNTIKLWNAI